MASPTGIPALKFHPPLSDLPSTPTGSSNEGYPHVDTQLDGSRLSSSTARSDRGSPPAAPATAPRPPSPFSRPPNHHVQGMSNLPEDGAHHQTRSFHSRPHDESEGHKLLGPNRSSFSPAPGPIRRARSQDALDPAKKTASSLLRPFKKLANMVSSRSSTPKAEVIALAHEDTLTPPGEIHVHRLQYVPRSELGLLDVIQDRVHSSQGSPRWKLSAKSAPQSRSTTPPPSSTSTPLFIGARTEASVASGFDVSSVHQEQASLPQPPRPASDRQTSQPRSLDYSNLAPVALTSRFSSDTAGTDEYDAGSSASSHSSGAAQARPSGTEIIASPRSSTSSSASDNAADLERYRMQLPRTIQLGLLSGHIQRRSIRRSRLHWATPEGVQARASLVPDINDTPSSDSPPSFPAPVNLERIPDRIVPAPLNSPSTGAAPSDTVAIRRDETELSVSGGAFLTNLSMAEGSTASIAEPPSTRWRQSVDQSIATDLQSRYHSPLPISKIPSATLPGMSTIPQAETPDFDREGSNGGELRDGNTVDNGAGIPHDQQSADHPWDRQPVQVVEGEGVYLLAPTSGRYCLSWVTTHVALLSDSGDGSYIVYRTEDGTVAPPAEAIQWVANAQSNIVVSQLNSSQRP